MASKNMKKKPLEKSLLFLILIIIFLIIMIITFYFILRTNKIAEIQKDKSIISLLLIIEKDGTPIATELFLYYSATGKGAFLDIPAETGLIIKSVNRVDRIDSIYDSNKPDTYISEIEALVGIELPFYITLKEDQFIRISDILEGLNVFIPNPLDTSIHDSRFLVPSGAMNLDGQKSFLYGFEQLDDEPETDKVERRQKLIRAFFKRVSEQNEVISHGKMFKHIYRNLRTNIDQVSLKQLFLEFSNLDADHIVMQRTSGVLTRVDEKVLLDPLWDGELVKDIVKQTLNALFTSDVSSSTDRIFRIEILNGTSVRRLAGKTAEVFRSFGYDIVTVSNADNQDYLKTIVYDRFGNEGAARSIADVIRCGNIQVGSYEGHTESIADFQIILGKDFNGRYCTD